MSGAEDLTPRVGLAVTFVNADGSRQRFECVEVRRGRAVDLAVWSTSCAGCGTQFTVAAPAKARTVRHRQRQLNATRCDGCRPAAAERRL